MNLSNQKSGFLFAAAIALLLLLGNFSTSAEAQTELNQPPTVGISASPYQNKLTLISWIFHNDPWPNLNGVTVEVIIDNQPAWSGRFGVATPNPYLVSYAYALDAGLHIVKTIVTDEVGASTTNIFSFTVVDQPLTLSNLLQWDGATSLSEGWILRSPRAVSFSANVSDPDGDQVKLQVELRRFEESFTGIDDGGILTSDPVPSGWNNVRITRAWLPDGKYHWRARAIDSNGNKSGWQEFGGTGNVDFEINQPPVLSFPETGPYAGDGIDPDSGDESTWFTFRVIYTDASDDKPVYVNVHIEVEPNNNGIIRTENVYATDFPDSLDYTVGQELLEGKFASDFPVGTYKYYFETFDGKTKTRLPTSGEFPLEITNSNNNVDTDGDELSDEDEISIGTDPQNPDTDGDGIKDGHEVNGVDVNGDEVIDLFFPDANPRRRDIFVEVDCMVDRCTNPSQERFREEVFDEVENVFANAPLTNHDGTQGISIHFLVDETDIPLEDDIGAEWFNTAGKVFFGTQEERQHTNSDAILKSKTEDFLFHYVFFVNKYEGENGGAGEMPGNDLVIANRQGFLGILNNSLEVQSSKLLHELGHNLGLGHGGRIQDEENSQTTIPDDTNCKPNYLSAMSYARSYNIYYGFFELRTLPRVFDFSSEVLPPLNENALNETAGIGTDQRTIFGPPESRISNGHSIDWNRDGDSTDENVNEVVINGRSTPADINWISDKIDKCGSNTETILEGSNDWGNLLFDAREYTWFTRGSVSASQNNGIIV